MEAAVVFIEDGLSSPSTVTCVSSAVGIALVVVVYVAVIIIVGGVLVDGVINGVDIEGVHVGVDVGVVDVVDIEGVLLVGVDAGTVNVVDIEGVVLVDVVDADCVVLADVEVDVVEGDGHFSLLLKFIPREQLVVEVGYFQLSDNGRRD